MNVEWKPGAELAEYAEALGVDTWKLMAVQVGEPSIVIYTPLLDKDNLDEETTIMFAVLDRDADGILVVMGEPIVGGSWLAMKTNIEAEIEKIRKKIYGE